MHGEQSTGKTLVMSALVQWLKEKGVI